ncbi:MAG: hypothetical protein KF754_02135 [Planctomycetes bacterium]|nr:hypothetical protein [Planctomycetota bacterium]
MALDYLLIPHQYSRHFGGAIWSPQCDAVTLDDGTTLALAPGIAQCLEGFGLRERPVHFGFVLHWLRLALAPGTEAPFDGLAAALRDTGGSLRNLGALLAELCRAIPRVPGHIDLREVGRLLRNPGALVEVHFFSRGGTTPPMSADAFESHLARMLAGLDASTLRHWLRHGRGPVLQAPAKAAPLLPPPPPRTLGSALDELLKRDRLRGVAPFLAQMVSALTLPPRHAQPASLPVGGYSSVTNRGQPDQILPHEFAGDEFEFLRRYAENELLYWQREEPQSQVREDMVVLLDQGVRTWGEPRLVLAAAAIALGRRAQRRGTPVRFAGTFNDGVPLDPVAATDADLGRLLDASDLSPNPGLALERVLEEPTPHSRDVVLLTHPLSLECDDVRTASRRAPQGTRVFAFTMDETGAATLSELRRGSPVTLRNFAVELVLAPAPAQPAARPDAAWQGDVGDPVSPFRLGLVGAVRHIAIDAEGTRVFAAGATNLIQVFTPDGEPAETLPPPALQGRPLRDANRLIGVRGGLVACFGAAHGHAMAHFDFASRRVRVFCPPAQAGVLPVLAGYDAQRHSLLALSVDSPGANLAVVDLANGSITTRRSHEAMAETLGISGLPPLANIIHQPRDADFESRARGPATGNFVLLNPAEGRLAALQRDSVWSPWLPRRDGRPLLKDCVILEAALAGHTLLLRIQRDGTTHELHAFSGPQWQYLGELATQRESHGLGLSGDGTLAALRTTQAEVRLARVETGMEPCGTLRAGKVHSELSLAVGANWLTVYGGKFTHLLRWDRDRLEISFLQGNQDIDAFQRRAREHAGLDPQHNRARHGLRLNLKTDASRFAALAQSQTGVVFATDHLGQVSVFGRDGKLAAMLFVYRSTVAAWLPDGTRYGPSGVTGGPTSAGALQRIGAALKAAGGAS